MGALGLGQLLLNVSDESGFVRFILVSCLLSMALGSRNPCSTSVRLRLMSPSYIPPI